MLQRIETARACALPGVLAVLTAVDYLADGLLGRAPKTIRTQREVLEPLLPILGNVPLRELTAADVRSALIKLAIER